MDGSRREAPESVVDCIRQSRNLLKSKHISKLRKLSKLKRITARANISDIPEKDLSAEHTITTSTNNSKQISVRLALGQVNLKVAPQEKHESSCKKICHDQNISSRTNKDLQKKIGISKSQAAMIKFLYKQSKTQDSSMELTIPKKHPVEDNVGDFKTYDDLKRKFSLLDTVATLEEKVQKEHFSFPSKENLKQSSHKNDPTHVEIVQEGTNVNNVEEPPTKNNQDEKEIHSFQPGDSAKACARYYKKAQEALTYLSDEVSSVLRNTYSNIDDIENRVRNTIQAINENTLQYQILKAQSHMPTVRPSEPTQNIDQLHTNILSQSEIKQTQSENQIRIPIIENNFEMSKNKKLPLPPFIPVSKDSSKRGHSPAESNDGSLSIKPKKHEKIREKRHRSQEKNVKHRSGSKRNTAQVLADLRGKLMDITNPECVNEMVKCLQAQVINKDDVKENIKLKKSIKVVVKSERKSREQSDNEFNLTRALAEELFVPEKKINKIRQIKVEQPENVILLTNDSVTKARRHKKTQKKMWDQDDYGKVSEKYSNSLWFSSKSKHNMKISKNVIAPTTISERLLNLQKSSVVIIENAIQTDNEYKLKPMKYKTGLNCFDIVDEITMNDIQPFIAEYPRRDFIGVKTYHLKVENMYLYKLVYTLPKRQFIDVVGIRSSTALLLQSNSRLREIGSVPSKESEKDTTDKSRSNFSNKSSLENVKKNIFANIMRKNSYRKYVSSRKKHRRIDENELTESEMIKKKMFSHLNKNLDKPCSSPIAAEIKTGEVHMKMHKHKTLKGRSDRDISTKLKPYMLDPCIGFPNIARVAPAFIVSNSDLHRNSSYKKFRQSTPFGVENFLKPYIYDVGVDCNTAVTVMPVFVTYDDSSKMKHAPPEVAAKLRPYLFDPDIQYLNDIVAFPALITNDKAENLDDKCENHICKQSQSRILENSIPMSNRDFSSSADIAIKLKPYIYDSTWNHPTTVTLMPAMVTLNNINTKDVIGDSNSATNLDFTTNAQSPLLNKIHIQSIVKDDQKLRDPKIRTSAANNLMAYLEKINTKRALEKTPPSRPVFPDKKAIRSVKANRRQRSLTPPATFLKVPDAPMTSTSAKNISSIFNRTLTPPPPETFKQEIPLRNIRAKYEDVPYEVPNKNVLENNIQNVIEMIESKIVDIISSPDKIHSDSFENVEQEIIHILEAIRNTDTVPLKTIKEMSTKGSQSDLESPKPKTPRKKTPKDEHFEVTSAFAPQQKLEQNNFFNDVHNAVDKLEKTVLEMKSQHEDHNIPTKLAKSNIEENKKQPKVSKRLKSYTKTDVQKMIEQKVESINEIIDNLNRQELEHKVEHRQEIKSAENKINETKKEVMAAISKSYKRAKKEKEKASKDDSENEQKGSKKTITLKEPKAKKAKLEEPAMKDKEVMANFQEQRLNEVKPSEVSEDPLQMTEKVESGEYLTPFMHALIKYRKQEDPTKISSASIIEFLDTLTNITEDVPNPLNRPEIPNYSSIIYYNRHNSMAPILEQPLIYYPITIYNSTRSGICEGSLFARFINLSRYCQKLVQSNALLSFLSCMGRYIIMINKDKRLAKSGMSSKLMIEPWYDKHALMYKKDPEYHEVLLNSVYSMLYAAMFFGLTLNYSCH